MDTPYQSAGSSFADSATKSTARRLRRTRQHLGSYRHNLLVAMRVVNNVEREMMVAEWENWLLDENTRCKKVQTMLKEGRANGSISKKSKAAAPQQVLDSESLGKLENLRQWHEDYCGSCLREQELLFEGRQHAYR
jgi:hypothetical protein